MSAGARLLAAVAAELATHGEVRLAFGGRVLFFCNRLVAQVNPSEAVILAAMGPDGGPMLPARSAVKGDTAPLLAALILARLALSTRKEAA